MNNLCTKAVVVASLTLSAVSAQAAPSFVNNSFESSFTGWSTEGSPDIQSFGFDGTRSVGGAVFSGGSSFENIVQTVSGFVPGSSYTLSFYQQNNGSLLFAYDDGPASWTVEIDNSPVFNSDLMSPGDSNWAQQSFDFQATSASHTFRFRPRDINNSAALPGDTGVYPVIDLIELADANVVPMPTTAAMLLPLAGLRLLRRGGVMGRRVRH